MEITDIRMTLLENSGNTKAIGTISLDNELAVRGMRVMESKTGTAFVSFPSRAKADGTYELYAYTLNKPLYHKITDALINEYNRLRDIAKLEKMDNCQAADREAAPKEEPKDQEEDKSMEQDKPREEEKPKEQEQAQENTGAKPHKGHKK